MAQLSIAYFIARIEELRRDWPLLLADADLGSRLFEEVSAFDFDDILREVLGSGLNAPA
jgi:hypothetical protein